VRAFWPSSPSRCWPAASSPSQGRLETYEGLRSSAPEWRAPCWRATPRHDRDLLARCARVEGRLVWARKDASGGLSRELHLAVLAHYRLYVLKLEGPHERLPRLGSTVGAIGPLVRASNGMDEVQVFAFDD